MIHIYFVSSSTVLILRGATARSTDGIGVRAGVDGGGGIAFSWLSWEEMEISILPPQHDDLNRRC